MKLTLKLCSLPEPCCSVLCVHRQKGVWATQGPDVTEWVSWSAKMWAVHGGVRVWKSLGASRERRKARWGKPDGHRTFLFHLRASAGCCGQGQRRVSLGQGCGWSPRMLASCGLGSFEDGPLNLTQEVQGRHKKHLLLLKPRQGEHMVWVVLCSPKSSVEVLTPGYLWIWLHLETGCIADVKVKMRSYYSRAGPWSNDPIW